LAQAETKPGLLNSWKEIATYLGRGVRTAQRWERHGLPVRRISPGSRSPVIAHAPDIDTWLHFSRQHASDTAEARREQVQARSERAALKICASLMGNEACFGALAKIIAAEFAEVHEVRPYE
jgi:hypothetical protein